MAERHLRVVDTDTGEVVDDQPSIQALSAALAKEQQANTALRQLLRDGPQTVAETSIMDKVREVHAYWQQVCDHPAARLGPERAKAVKQALTLKPDPYTVEELKRACNGAARFPFVVDGQRMPAGHRSERFDDLELICRDERKIDRFIELAEDEPTERPAQDGSGSHVTVDPGELVAAAARYARFGMPVFPCRQKRPLLAHGLHDATVDHTLIGRWWARWPDAQVAVRTGQVSALIVLDVDGDEGFDHLHRLERTFGTLPTTASVKTPSGGEHFWFRHPGGTVPNTTGWPAPGLDVRGDGGYVIAPPSSSGNGCCYEPDEQAPIAETPGWLVRILRSQNGRRGRPRPVGAEIAAGQRNDVLTSLAGSMRKRGMGAAEIAAALEVTNRTRCRPPLPDDEVDRIAESVSRYEPGTP